MAIEKGDIDVSHKNAKADCVVRADKTLFDGIAAGEVNAFAAALRGLIDIEGNPELLVSFNVSSQHRRGAVLNDDLVKILDGNTFVVSDSRGDIEASLTDPTGLFSFDSRFLSTWILTVDGERLNPLSSTTCSTSRHASSSCRAPGRSTSTPSCP